MDTHTLTYVEAHRHTNTYAEGCRRKRGLNTKTCMRIHHPFKQSQIHTYTNPDSQCLGNHGDGKAQRFVTET